MTKKTALKHLLACVLLLGIVSFASAQKTIVNDEQLWLGVFNQTRFTNKWGIWADAHFRLRDQLVQEKAQGIIRLGLTYYLLDDVRLTAAYAYIHHFPGDSHPNTFQPEHRPWQQVQWFMRWPRARLMQWVRLEERYRRNILDGSTLGEGYTFNFRIRYNFALFLPLTAKKFDPGAWLFLLNDEIMINFGDNIVYNHFDQNRFFAGLVYQLTPHAQIHAGYMNLYQQQAAGNVFRNQHTLRLFYFHNLDLRKKQHG